MTVNDNYYGSMDYSTARPIVSNYPMPTIQARSWECHRCGTVWASWMPCCNCKVTITTSASSTGTLASCPKCGAGFYVGKTQLACTRCDYRQKVESKD